MPIDVTYDEKKELIVVDSYGNIQFQNLRETLDQIKGFVLSTGSTKVFVDATKEDSLPGIYNVYRFGKLIAEETCLVKYAIIPSESTIRELKFMETVSINHGGLFRLFESKSDAIKWLSLS